MTRTLRTKSCLRIALAFTFIVFGIPAKAHPQAQPQAPQPHGTTAESQGQPQDTAKPADQSQSLPEKHAQKDDRIFGVMPNHLTVENGAKIEPLTWKGKFKVTAEGAFDPYEFLIVGLVASIHQAENSDAPFGQGMQGYAKRYGAGFADQAIGNMMTGAIFPSLLHTDPRYYRMGEGTLSQRLRYSLTRILITRTDSGHRAFNFSELGGSAAGAAISNLYYPAQDRTVSNNLTTWGTQIAIDCFGNELKEFWPDIHRKFRKN